MPDAAGQTSGPPFRRVSREGSILPTNRFGRGTSTPMGTPGKTVRIPAKLPAAMGKVGPGRVWSRGLRCGQKGDVGRAVYYESGVRVEAARRGFCWDRGCAWQTARAGRGGFEVFVGIKKANRRRNFADLALGSQRPQDARGREVYGGAILPPSNLRLPTLPHLLLRFPIRALKTPFDPHPLWPQYKMSNVRCPPPRPRDPNAILRIPLAPNLLRPKCKIRNISQLRDLRSNPQTSENFRRNPS